MKKKILANIAILLILTGGFCNVYIKGIGVSGCGNQLSAFAADDTYSWESVSKDDLVTAFKYYCKSRNLAIEGSVADAVTSFTTSTFNNICNTLGIDSTALQAELKKTTGGNLGLRFLFTQAGVSAYNRIFAEFLQNNNLDVGDTVEDENVYSGEVFTDADGNTCLVWDMPSISQGSNGNNLPIKYGTVYKYDGYDVNSLHENGIHTITFTINRLNGQPYTIQKTIQYTDRRDNLIDVRCSLSIGISGWPQGLFYALDLSNKLIIGKSIVYRVNGGSDLYIGQYVDLRNTNTNGQVTPNARWYYYDYFTQADGLENADVNITTNNTTINNNNYNNNYTIIYNDGDVYYNDDDDDDEPSPTTPPGGGGGGGGDDPDQPPIVDPTPTPDPTVPDWDIELPQMPTGNDWLLFGMEKKFPWDIPFNLMYMLSLFAADPETPHFQGTIDLKICQWDYDIDLAPFDDIARNVRNFEFIGFLIGLMLITRKLIWG